MPEGRCHQNEAGLIGPGSVAARTPASGWAELDWASARLTPTLSLCQSQRGQTTLPFSAPGSFWGGKGPRLPCWPSARPMSSWGLQGRPLDYPSCSGHREVLGVCRQYPDWDKVAEGGLEEMPTQLPAWAGSGRVGGWQWKSPGHFSDKAGGGGLLPEEAVPEQPASLTQRWCRGRNTYLSQLCQECGFLARVGRSLPGGWRLGKGPDLQNQEDPAGPGGETEEGKS